MLFPISEIGYWMPIKDGDPRAFAIFRRHYSYYDYADGRRKRYRADLRFIGPGSKLVLLGSDERALFGWRLGRDASQGYGVSCTVFRNESKYLSSDLIREANALAWQRWPHMSRHFTYVNPSKVQSSNPGYCFLMAGWQKCGMTKSGLIIMEIRSALEQ